MSAIELIAVLLGIANILLIIRRSVWNFPFGIAMVSLYAFIFWGAKLYSDAGLQIFFLVVQFYGWWAWSRDKIDQGEIVVRRLSGRMFTLVLAAGVTASLLWGWFLHNRTDASLPYLDAPIAMFSVTAQILMTRRFIENWHWWIVVNIISIGTYFIKGLYLTTGLYVLFFGLAVLGLIEWRKAEHKAAAA